MASSPPPGSIQNLQSFIDGNFVSGGEGRDEILNPSSESVIAVADRAGEEEIDAAVRAARKAFDSWSATTPAERSRALLRIADRLEAESEDLARAESADAGKPIRQVLELEIGPTIDSLRFFAGAARSMDGPTAGEYLPGHTSMIRREAAGVCALIAPWNYPLMMAAWKIAPTIASGCTGVLKPADNTPLTAVKLVEAAAEFLPPGVINLVLGDRETGRALVTHPEIDMISLTGSTRAGRQVASAASGQLKRLHLELGGKAPVVIFDDVDIEPALDAIAEAGFVNSGQDCTAATRVIVAEGVYDEVRAGLAERAERYVLGDTDKQETTLGPVSSAAQRDRIEGFLHRRPEHSEILTGGTAPDRPGFFLEPTVVSGLRQDDEMIQSEIFGPVMTVQAFKDESEAVSMANGTPYGLASSIWTDRVDVAMRVSKQLRFGCVWVNCHMMLASEMPHGGFKQSGYGKDLSRYALDDYTVPKHVMFATG